MLGLLSQFTRPKPTFDDFKNLLEKLTEKFNQPNKKESEESLIFSQGHNGHPIANPIVFLDFDGVCWIDDDVIPHKIYRELRSDRTIFDLLTSYGKILVENFGILEDDEGGIFPQEFMNIACWDPEHMERIRKLCENHNANIVVTSSWRNGRSITQLKNILDLWGLGQRVIGKTKDSMTLAGQRASEIQTWLDENKHIASGFVVLDDMYVRALRNQFGDKFVHCNPFVGFNEAAFNKANASLAAQKELVLQESDLNLLPSSPLRLAN